MVKNLFKDYEFEDDFEEELSDEELDALYRPKKTNSRKDLVPMFVYKILTEETSVDVHLTQKQIEKRLAEYPYEVSIERKALSRVIHGLEDTGFGIVSIQRKGCYYDPDKIWA